MGSGLMANGQTLHETLALDRQGPVVLRFRALGFSGIRRVLGLQGTGGIEDEYHYSPYY